MKNYVTENDIIWYDITSYSMIWHHTVWHHMTMIGISWPSYWWKRGNEAMIWGGKRGGGKEG